MTRVGSADLIATRTGPHDALVNATQRRSEVGQRLREVIVREWALRQSAYLDR